MCAVLYAGGSINIRTRKTTEGLVDPAESSVIKEIFVRGYSNPARYYTPKYNVEPSHPQYVQFASVHWEPEIVTDSSGKGSFLFMLPAGSGEVSIRAEGIGENGVVLFYEKKLLVK